MRPPARRLRSIARLDDPPWRLALALALGVFISCTPFYGLQTVLSIAAATALRLSATATVVGCWFNLPWFAPFVYASALWIGGLLVPGNQGRAAAEAVAVLLASGSVSWADAVELLRDAALALLVGTTVVGGVAAVATWVIAFGVIRRRRGQSMMEL